jgi:hypothetical protein
MNDKLNQIAAIEKAIRQKYGKEAIVNPNSGWSEDKEKEYLEQLKEFSEAQYLLEQQQEKVEIDGFLINKKLLTREINILNCPVCFKRLNTIKDDLYNNKFECCQKCYIQYVEGREKRWLKGWRPGETKCHKKT